jgi:hypothetical protein
MRAYGALTIAARLPQPRHGSGSAPTPDSPVRAAPAPAEVPDCPPRLPIKVRRCDNPLSPGPLHLWRDTIMGTTGASVFKRCGCRDKESGRQLGGPCPRLPRRGHGSWYLAAELPAGSDGRRRRVRLGGYPTRPDAEAMLARLRVPGGSGRSAAVSCTTGRWLARWLAARQSLGPSARRSYQQHLNDYLITACSPSPRATCALAAGRGQR